MNNQSKLLDPVKILYDSKHSVVQDAALIIDNHLIAFGNEARKQGKAKGIANESAENQLLAPCLVDPHSVLEAPINSKNENLQSLKIAAANAGYGQLALLPRSNIWRDRPELLKGFSNPQTEVVIHLWGSFSKSGQRKELAPHADLLENGAIGLAEDDLMLPIDLLKKGLVLGEIGSFPLLVAPRDADIQGNGMVREGVEALRAGWPPDPRASETFPLTQLIELHRQHPKSNICLMNISTADGISILQASKNKPLATVCWWHLVADGSLLSPIDLGWRITPSIGTNEDRKSLIKGLLKGILTAVAVNSIPLDKEEILLPPDQRQPGLCGYQLVLPALWQELIVKEGWSIEELWKVLSFGPSRMINTQEESLEIGSRRWLLFDPQKTWEQSLNNKGISLGANQPWEGKELTGKIISCGLIDAKPLSD